MHIYMPEDMSFRNNDQITFTWLIALFCRVTYIRVSKVIGCQMCYTTDIYTFSSNQKRETNHGWLANLFFLSAAYNWFEVWLVHWTMSFVIWFYYTQLKTTLHCTSNAIEVKELLSLPGLNWNIILRPLSKPSRPRQRTDGERGRWTKNQIAEKNVQGTIQSL